jgi:hypothetical protein
MISGSRALPPVLTLYLYGVLRCALGVGLPERWFRRSLAG